ncbi:MAG: helix-turn-helix domain-containing protein [Gammaproteobacteria bacterium]
MALLSLCLIAIVISMPSSLGGSFSTQYLLQRFVYATPAVLWLTAHYFFNDDHRVSPLMWLALLGYQFLIAIGPVVFPDHGQRFGLILQLSYPFMLGLIIHVLVITLGGKSGDLVGQRRRLRVPFSVALVCILALMIVLAMLFSFAPLPATVLRGLIQYSLVFFNAMIFLFALLLNLATLESAGQPMSTMGTRYPVNSAARDPVKDLRPVSQRILNRISELMEEQKLYKEPHLTIGDLAQKIHAGEHKLRKVINAELGYRNFNQFLNKHRIEEAKELLLAPEQAPIHHIAFEVGFASLSSFNKAFKEITGLTPTSFRNDEGVVATEAERPGRVEIQDSDGKIIRNAGVQE